MRRILYILLSIAFSINIISADPRSGYSKHTSLPKEKTGFRLYIDAMLSADLSDDLGKKTLVPGATIAPGAQITHHFFIGAKGGAIYIPYDFFTYPVAVNPRWTFGRKNILIIDMSGGVSFYDSDIHPYGDFSFGGRIPLCPKHFLHCSLGFVIFPQYTDKKDKETGEHSREVMSWISPQLKVSYPFTFEKDRKKPIRYRLWKSEGHNRGGESPKKCFGKETPNIEGSHDKGGESPKSCFMKNKPKRKKEPKNNHKERVEGNSLTPEKPDVQRWRP